MDASPVRMSSPLVFSTPVAYPVIVVPLRVSVSPLASSESIPTVEESLLPVITEDSSVTSQLSISIAMSDRVMVFRAVLMLTPSQSSRTSPTALGAVRPAEMLIELSARVGPVYPAATPPSTMNTSVPPSPYESVRASE